MMVSNFSTESYDNKQLQNPYDGSTYDGKLKLMMVATSVLNLMMVSKATSVLNLMMVSNFSTESYDGKQLQY